MCYNTGYFCCPSRTYCYGFGWKDGCAEIGYSLKEGEIEIPTLPQEHPVTAKGTTSTHSFATVLPPTLASTHMQISQRSDHEPGKTTSQHYSIAAQSSTTSSQGTSPAHGSGARLSTSDTIAIAIDVPVGIATMLGTFFTWKVFQRSKMRKREGRR